MNDEAVSAAQRSEKSGELLDRVCCVLVEPSHPGNIGAAARALKTMGIGRLALVKPRVFPSPEATARASGADDVLAAATVHSTLAEAIADCAIAVGTTARARYIEWPVEAPRDAAAWIAARPGAPRVALVFGREQAGLTNAEMALCQRMIRIPTNPEYSSLNLAQAVQLCAYEVRLQALAAAVPAAAPQAAPGETLATAAELAQLTAHWLRVMTRVDYFDPDKPKLLPRRVRRLLNKAALLHSEAQILRGFLTAVERTLGGA